MSQKEIDEYLDTSIGGNTKLLQDLLRSLHKERDSLEKQLSGVGLLDEGSEWLTVVTEVQSTIAELETLHSNATAITQTDIVRGDCAFSVKSDAGARVGGGSVRSEAGACVEALRPLVEELAELEKLYAYLAWIKQVNQLCAGVKGHLDGGLMTDALSAYQQLSSVSITMETSDCTHLRCYVLSSKTHWHTRLAEKLSSDFAVILKELQWPFTTSAVSSQSLEVWNKNKKRFTEVFNLWVELDKGDSQTRSTPPLLSDPLMTPLELLVQPLRKRFKYHFFGERKTNSKKKPEWYLTQVSSWIRDHSHFLEERIQPLLSASVHSGTDARIEFIRGLLQEVEAKVQADLSEVVYDDSLMAHLIDELLMFERELRTVIEYTHPNPTPFNVLLGEVPFHKWLSLEKAFAIERMNTIVSDESAWQPAYDGIANADDTKVPQCTEGIMELVKGITDRYSSLTSVRHQLQFLELQRDLLLEFHHDLVTNADSVTPLQPQFIAYLNASNYITTVLRDWGEQLFFLELHYHTQEEGGANRAPLSTVQLLRKQDPDYAASEGSAFSIVTEAFSSLVERLGVRLVGGVLNSLRGKTSKYKKEKWHSMVPAGKDESVRDVTPSVAELATLLREHLLFIDDQLSPLLSKDIFEQIASKVDKLIFTDVVLCSHFSEGGAEQLHHDITTALHPLLARYTDQWTQQQLMERTLEACRLLQLLPGSAKLTLSLLQSVVGGGAVQDHTYSQAVSALNDMGVHTLDPTQAQQVLKHRILSS